MRAHTVQYATGPSITTKHDTIKCPRKNETMILTTVQLCSEKQDAIKAQHRVYVIPHSSGQHTGGEVATKPAKN